MIAGDLWWPVWTSHLRNDNGRYRWHKAPAAPAVGGKVLYQATLARFSRLFALVQSSGIPIVTGLSVVARALDNDFLEERILTCVMVSNAANR